MAEKLAAWFVCVCACESVCVCVPDMDKPVRYDLCFIKLSWKWASVMHVHRLI